MFRVDPWTTTEIRVTFPYSLLFLVRESFVFVFPLPLLPGFDEVYGLFFAEFRGVDSRNCCVVVTIEKTRLILSLCVCVRVTSCNVSSTFNFNRFNHCEFCKKKENFTKVNLSGEEVCGYGVQYPER